MGSASTLELKQHLESIKRHLKSLAGGLQRRVLAVLIAYGLGMSLTWWYRKVVLAWMLVPAHGRLTETGLPIYTSPTEMFNLSWRLAWIGGAVAAIPVLTYAITSLVRPILKRQQRWFLDLFLPAIFVCFLVGNAFGYFVLLPTGLSFLLQIGDGIATPMISVTKYADLVLAMVFWLGVVFELPFVMLLLAKLRLVTYQRFRIFRRYVPTAAFLFTAFITPTVDLTNNLLVGGPLILLYEVGLVLAFWARPRPPKPAGGFKSLDHYFDIPGQWG